MAAPPKKFPARKGQPKKKPTPRKRTSGPTPAGTTSPSPSPSASSAGEAPITQSPPAAATPQGPSPRTVEPLPAGDLALPLALPEAPPPPPAALETTEYDPQLFEDICTDLAATDDSLRRVARARGVHLSSFFRWINRDDTGKLWERYARARQAQAEVTAEMTKEIADDAADDYVEDSKGRMVFNKEAVLRARLRVDTRLRLMAKMHPKRWGDKLELTGQLDTKAYISPEQALAMAKEVQLQLAPQQQEMPPDGSSAA